MAVVWENGGVFWASCGRPPVGLIDALVRHGKIVLRSRTLVAVPAHFGCNPVGSGERILLGNWFAWRGVSAE